jgi:hypothetical protein
MSSTGKSEENIMAHKEKNAANVSNKPTTRRRKWLSLKVRGLSINASEEEFRVKINPALGTAWKRHFRLSLRTALFAIVLSMSGCDIAPRVKKVFCGVIHSFFAKNHTGMQDQQKKFTEGVNRYENQEAGHNQRL